MNCWACWHWGLSLLGFNKRVSQISPTKFSLWADFIPNLSSLLTQESSHRGHSARLELTDLTSIDPQPKMVTKNLLPCTRMTATRGKRRGPVLQVPRPRATPPQSPVRSPNSIPFHCSCLKSCKCNYDFISQIQQHPEQENTRNLIRPKAWTNLEKHILNVNQTRIILFFYLIKKKSQSRKIFKNSKNAFI